MLVSHVPAVHPPQLALVVQSGPTGGSTSTQASEVVVVVVLGLVVVVVKVVVVVVVLPTIQLFNLSRFPSLQLKR